MRRGALYLDGILNGEAEHRVLIHTLTDAMGFPAVIDHLDINEPLASGRRRAAKPAEEADEMDETSPYESEEMTEGSWGARDDETSYSSAGRPLPEQDREYRDG